MHFLLLKRTIMTYCGFIWRCMFNQTAGFLTNAFMNVAFLLKSLLTFLTSSRSESFWHLVSLSQVLHQHIFCIVCSELEFVSHSSGFVALWEKIVTGQKKKEEKKEQSSLSCPAQLSIKCLSHYTDGSHMRSHSKLGAPGKPLVGLCTGRTSTGSTGLLR